VLSSAWKPWKLTRDFSFNWPQDVIDLDYNRAYQFIVALSSDMVNNLVRVVSSPPDEAIAAS
jgi:hypothetical protein